MTRRLEEEYVQILRDYLNSQEEDELYGAQKLGKWLLLKDISPEELVDLHSRALESVEEVPEFVRASFRMLTEVMIEYGNAHRSLQSWRNKHAQLQSEVEIASAMQQSLLPQTIPTYPGVEIGVVSIAANGMSGDYYDFMHFSGHRFSLTIGDITGKGIPAAMCMSMLKYAVDSLGEIQLGPNQMLRHLNRVVERNIDPSMFVTMLFGCYDTNHHCFRYAVAGHEPGFLYRARERKFYDLEGRGIALGISADSTYVEHEVALQTGDVLILLTDGVTESKKGRSYLVREDLVGFLQNEVDKPAQLMAEEVYRRLMMLAQFEQRDDYTMIVLRRT